MSAIKRVFTAIGHFFVTINKGNWRYKVVALLGLLFRVIALPFIVPDFFEMIFPFFITWNMPDWLYQIVLRLFLLVIDFVGLSSIYYLLSYGSTGLYYKRSSAPALGSAFYTFFYFIYSLIPVLLIQYFYWWVILIIFVAYCLICLGLYCLSGVLNALPENSVVNIIAHAIITAVLFVVLMCIWGFVP